MESLVKVVGGEGVLSYSSKPTIVVILSPEFSVELLEFIYTATYHIAVMEPEKVW